MPVQATTTTTTTTQRAGLHGIPGAIFWMIIVAIMFYTLGFATVGWAHVGAHWMGLWLVCAPSDTIIDRQHAAWLKATQTMITIGLILLLSSMLTILFYIFVHSLTLSKTTLMRAFAALAFVAVVFMFIGFIVFGAKLPDHLNWSYAFCVIGSVFCLVAAVLSIVQMNRSRQ